MWFDILKDSKQVSRTMGSIDWENEEIPEETDDDCLSWIKELGKLIDEFNDFGNFNIPTGSQVLHTFNRDSSNVTTLYLYGSSVDTHTRSGTLTVKDVVGVNGSFDYRGKQQEIIFWSSDQTSNRTGIESNVNTYFSIY